MTTTDTDRDFLTIHLPPTQQARCHSGTLKKLNPSLSLKILYTSTSVMPYTQCKPQLVLAMFTHSSNINLALTK
ncbi:hypothetical protein MH171_004179 [Vibrio parahaemolyticus]|nr:hypothetical protein [Vibrio parahaemolyticus]ELA7258655.1 hypothetical protein [Vibrio parahaemolyticus]EMF1842315.1 hypothetical protein [Vibrio parahaemolyticus]